MFHLLPMLKGWEYKDHVVERTIIRGASPIEKEISETGWLLTVFVVSDDCYGTLRIAYQGADLQMRTVTVNAESLRILGALSQDPGGWLQRYFRPDPNSTAGIFVSVLFSGGYQGSTFPYIPTVKMSAFLPDTSTQASASILAVASGIAITNRNLFIHSLRRILEANAPLEVDPAILAIGPEVFKEIAKGGSEEK